MQERIDEATEASRYWTRRRIILAIVILVAFGLGWALSGSPLIGILSIIGVLAIWHGESGLIRG